MEKYARFLAPLALVAVTVGIYLVVHDNLSHHAATGSTSQSVTVQSTRRPTRSHQLPRFYTVRPGDTLSQIAARSGVSIAQLTALNRAVAASPDSLQTGQRLRLRR